MQFLWVTIVSHEFQELLNFFFFFTVFFMCCKFMRALCNWDNMGHKQSSYSAVHKAVQSDNSGLDLMTSFSIFICKTGRAPIL